MSYNNQQEEQGEPDDIDFFLENEEARPTYSDSGLVDESLSSLYESGELLDLCGVFAYAAGSMALRYVTASALKRISYVLSTQREIQRDGRLPAVVGAEESKKKKAQDEDGAKRAAPPLSATSCIPFLYCNGGRNLHSFLRGAKLNFLLSTATYAEEVGMLWLFARLKRSPLAAWLTDSSGGLAWAGVVVAPLLVGVALWPLKALRTVMMVNYAGDVRSSNNNCEETLTDTKKNDNKATTIPPSSEEPAMAYRFSGYRALWQTVRSRMGWRGVLLCGWDAEFINRYLSVTAAKVVQPAIQALLLYARRPTEERTFGPIYVLVALNLVIGLVNVLHRPLLVLRERMSVLPRSAEEAEGTHGRRYRSVFSCAKYIWRHEGIRGFFDGLTFSLVINCALPLLQTLILGNVYLPQVDAGII